MCLFPTSPYWNSSTSSSNLALLKNHCKWEPLLGCWDRKKDANHWPRASVHNKLYFLTAKLYFSYHIIGGSSHLCFNEVCSNLFLQVSENYNDYQSQNKEKNKPAIWLESYYFGKTLAILKPLRPKLFWTVK